jgi:hypothetical protein
MLAKTRIPTGCKLMAAGVLHTCQKGSFRLI